MAPVICAEQARDELHALHQRYDDSGGDTALWQRLQARRRELAAMGGQAAAGAERYAEDIAEAADLRGCW